MNTIYEHIDGFYVFIHDISGSKVYNLAHDLDCSLTILLTVTVDLKSPYVCRSLIMYHSRQTQKIKRRYTPNYMWPDRFSPS